jgi:sterol desaturase/sphingolipid hydroxylase (fatty acid hydroxylase superfamily)
MTPLVYNGALFGGIGLLVLAELRSERFRKGAYDKANPARPRRNWAFLVAALIAGNTVQLIAAGLRDAVVPSVDWSGHVFLELLACFLVAELFGWAAHYLKHTYGALWNFHFQHHRETHFNVWMVTHTHALEVLFSGSLMMALLVVLGFSAPVMQAYLLFYSLANTYQHSSFDLSLGWIDKVIVSPAYHRYHHAVGSQVNYGNTLTVWDVVFRTARVPVGAAAPDVEIGLGQGPEPYGFWSEMTWCLRAPDEAVDATLDTEFDTQ